MLGDICDPDSWRAYIPACAVYNYATGREATGTGPGDITAPEDIQFLPSTPLVEPSPQKKGLQGWQYALIGASILVGATILGLGARKAKRKKNPRTVLGDFVALGSIAFGAIAVAFPDPAPFAGPSTLIGLPLMGAGLFYFGIEDKGKGKK